MKNLSFSNTKDMSVLCLRATISEVDSKLIHDIETNPGPCSQVSIWRFIHTEKYISGWLPWCRCAWHPKWLPFPRFWTRSIGKAAGRLHVHQWRLRSLYKDPQDGHQSLHWSGTSRRRWEGSEGCAELTHRSRRNHLGRIELTLHQGEARRGDFW